MANLSHYIYNKQAYSKPYESSLFVSLLLIIFALEHKSVHFKLIDYFLLLSCSALLFVEPLFQFPEYSYLKMIGRSIALLWYIMICSMNVSPTVHELYTYFIGYFLCSVLVQGYSLFRKRKSFSKIKKSISKEFKEKKIVLHEWINWFGSPFHLKLDIQWTFEFLVGISILFNLFMLCIYNC